MLKIMQKFIFYTYFSYLQLIFDSKSMSFFSKFKTYFVSFSSTENQQYNSEDQDNEQPALKRQQTDSFELIVQDILEIQAQLGQRKNSKTLRQPKKSADLTSGDFQPLVMENFQQQEDIEIQEECHNMYMTGIIFINKFSQGRQITIVQWNQMILKHNLSLQSQKDIYFSILKGIHFSVRKKVWQLLSNTAEMKKQNLKTFEQLTSEQFTPKKQLSIIDKDVPRSVNITKYLKELRNVLIAYVNYSGKQYTQGMNLIAGAIIQMLSYQNDNQLEEFEVIEDSLQERAFWVFVGIMKYRNWEHVFEKDLSGLKQMLQKLEKLMVQYVPAVYQKIIDYEWDLTIFSQYYITIMLYNTPKDFAKIILDLFLLDGEKVLHSLIIRMLKLNEDTIIGFIEEGELMNYFKKQMIHETFDRLQKDKVDAKKLEDFQINFLEFTKFQA